eukprot:jgi/Ulvmu1/2790/UM140_0020.1
MIRHKLSHTVGSAVSSWIAACSSTPTSAISTGCRQLRLSEASSSLVGLPSSSRGHGGIVVRGITTRPLPEHVEDPTGLFQYEVNNEAIMGKTREIRNDLKHQAAKAIHDALAPALKVPVPALPADDTSIDAVAFQEARAAAIGATVALALAGDGHELHRIAELAPALGPADDALLDILQHITTMPAGPGFDAFMQLLQQRANDKSFQVWHGLTARDGEHAALEAPPRLTRDHAVEAASKELLEDLLAALHSHATQVPHLHERSFRQDVLAGTHNATAAAAQPEFTIAELMTWQQRQDDWRQSKAAALAAALRALPEDDLQSLLALRVGRRRWRLDLDDWHNLARALLAAEPRGPRPVAPLAGAGGGTVDLIHVRRVVLGCLLRGHVLARRPVARRNEYLMRAATEAAAVLPRADVEQLLYKWRSLSPEVAERAALRALRYGELNPADERRNVDAARRFVRGMLAQVLLEAMPSSWVAWSGHLAHAVDQLETSRLWPLADALTLPRALADIALTHAVLELIAPQELESARTLGYFEEAQKIWEEVGAKQCLADEHLVAELVPRVIAHMANRHGTPAGESTTLLDNELLLQVAAALGQMQTSSLFELSEGLHRLSVTELRATIEAASFKMLEKLGITKEEFLAKIRSAAKSGEEKVDSSTRADLQEADVMDQRLAHVESFRPAAWLPPEVMPMQLADPRDVTRAFHDLVYALAGVLHDDVLTFHDLDADKARLLYTLGEELNLLNPESNAPTVIEHLLSLIPFDGIDAYLPSPDAAGAPVAAPALTGPDSILSAGQHTAHYTPILAATLTLIKSAVRRCPQAARELLPTESGVRTPGLSQDPETGAISCATLEGISVNAAVQLLMAAEAARLAEAGGLLAPTVATVRWAFENTPRNIPLTLMQYWGDPWQGDIAPLEIAYACARLARRDEGVRHACKILDFPQKLEVAHVVVSRRLQEAGALGTDYVAAEERNRLIVREVQRAFADAGDAQTAAEDAPKSLGRYLDRLPTAQEAIDYHLATSDHMRKQEATGGDPVTLRLRRGAHADAHATVARLDRPGAIAAKFAAAGDALVLPDLLQNIADRPLDEVLPFFRDLESLPERPDIDTLRKVFSWYDDGFLKGVDVEADPAGAWREFERQYLVEPNLVHIKQHDGPDITTYVPPSAPDLRGILAGKARAPRRPPAAAAETAPAVPAGGAGPAAGTAAVLPDRVPEVDAKGRALATGRRKASSARVWLWRGVGDVSVNGKPLGRYFEQQAQRAAAVAPLTALKSLAGYTVMATVEGGGRKGQAEAIQLGVARALVKLEPATHTSLKALGLLTRDPRVVESKKPGRKKARKKRQWVKR